MPATSQLHRLISITTTKVYCFSRAARDLLKSFGCGMGALHRLCPATMVPCPRRPPHSIFALLLRWLARLLHAFLQVLAKALPIARIGLKSAPQPFLQA